MKKTKTLVVTLLAGFILYQLALCQTNAADATPTVPGGTAASPATSNDVYSLMVSNVIKLSTTGETSTNTAMSAPPKITEGSNQPVSFTTSNGSTAAPTSNIVVAGTGESNTLAVVTGSNEPASGASTSNAPAAADGGNQSVSTTASDATAGTGSTNTPPVVGTNTAAAELPIQFQDVPITTAIESLARLAGINYLLDPKIGYGQPDADGHIKPEPTLSIRWDNVTAEQALVALLDNYGLQLAQNPKTKIYKITARDASAPPPMITRVIQLKYASTSNMVAAVQSALTDKRDKVVPDPRTSQLVVVATESEQADVDTLISQLDKPTRQVLIETKLIELSSNPSSSKGVDWSGTLQAQNFAFGNGVLSQSGSSVASSQSTTTPAATGPGGLTIPGSTGIGQTVNNTVTTTTSSGGALAGLAMNTASGMNPATGFLTADGVRAVLSFLNQSSEAQVVSTPRVVTLDNETATISVTRAFPILNITAGTANTTGGSSLTYSNLGTILLVTPRISANDDIWLKVNPTVSSYFGQDKQTINGQVSTADIFDLRSIDTQVLIPNAHTLVMGGLVKDNPNAQYTKVPILGDIPYLGVAFRSETKSMEKDNLLIFITPTIVRETDFKPMISDFLDSSPRTLKDPMNMHAWLDSAQPRGDWSNPLAAEKGDKTQNPDEGKTMPTP
jgi:type II secretory pathway component GspD/PulD (secretin)